MRRRPSISAAWWLGCSRTWPCGSHPRVEEEAAGVTAPCSVAGNRWFGDAVFYHGMSVSRGVDGFTVRGWKMGPIFKLDSSTTKIVRTPIMLFFVKKSSFETFEVQELDHEFVSFENLYPETYIAAIRSTQDGQN